MAQRLKGQDIQVFIIYPGGTPEQFLDIQSLDVTPKFEKLEEQYLGETSKRYDEIFHGVDFKMDAHVESPAVFALVNAIKSRAQTRGGGDAAAKINVHATLSFAGGVTRKVFLNDCFFEDVPFTVGGRSSYAQVTFSGSCTDIKT